MILRLALVPLLTVAAALLGFALDSRWMLPLLTALPGYAALVTSLRAGRRGRAIGLTLWWALWLGLSMVMLTMSWPVRAESVVLNGPAYRDEMFGWIASGVGRESTPSLFIPQHLAHVGIFSLLSILTGSALSILMGAVLMSYMSFYVGSLILACAQSPSHAIAVLIAWNPWSMVRVASFVVIGVVLAEPVLHRVAGGRRAPGSPGRWLAVAGCGLIVDMMLKAFLAPFWPPLLAGCLGAG